MPIVIRVFAAAAVLLATLGAARSKPVGPSEADSLRRTLRARVTEHLANAQAEPHAPHATHEAAPRPGSPHGTAPSRPTASAAPAVQERLADVLAHPGSPAEGATKPAPGDEAWGTWRDLLSGNLRFAEGKPRIRALVSRREALRASQKPRAIILGCADSRCPPELLFDQSLGDLFVVRTAGNVADPVALGSIEYAVEHLGARLLVVLGHDACGAVKATIAGGELPTDNLKAIVRHIAPAVNATSVHWQGDELLPHAIAANAQQSARDLLTRSPILRDAASHGHVRIVTAVYSFDDGRVRPLD